VPRTSGLHEKVADALPFLRRYRPLWPPTHRPSLLRLAHSPQRQAGLDLAGELLNEFAPVGADPPLVAHEDDPDEQIPRDHKAVEARRTAPEWLFCSKNFSRAFT
jgi:hypothetical protein